MTDDKRPILAITIGDAAGIGPEIVVKALARPKVRQLCRALVVGDLATMRSHLRFRPGGQPSAFVGVDGAADIEAWDWESDDLPVLQPGTPMAGLEMGKLSALAGRGAVEYVLAAVELAKAGKVVGIVTAPLNKEAIHLAGYTYPGHT